jgi:hypothetical protein|tara:strand:+ start:217 stop:450 length:234 start_codon:yes stop_codon:yes gene_type:complete
MKYDKKRMMTNKKPNWWLVEDPKLTPVQIKNRIVMRRWLRKWKKRLTPDDIIFPFFFGILLLGLIGYIAVQMKLGGI